MGNILQPLWADCPAFSRILIVGYPSCSLICLFAETVHYRMTVVRGFICCLETVVGDWYVWTMLTGAFYRQFAGGMSFLMMLFELYMVAIYMPSHEKDLGSLLTFVWVLLMNFVTNIIFLALMFFLSKTSSPHYAMLPNQGLWPVLMICLTLQMMSNPGGSTSFWGIAQIPNKWYPIGLVGFFSLLSMSVMWNLIAALAIGYGSTYLRLDKLLPSRVTVNKVEQRCCGAHTRSILGASWVRASDTNEFQLESGDRRYATLADFGRPGASGTQLQARTDAEAMGSAANGNFVAFAGSGQRLGDGGDATEPARSEPVSRGTALQELEERMPPAMSHAGVNPTDVP